LSDFCDPHCLSFALPGAFFLWQATQNGRSYIRKEDIIIGLGTNERSINRIIKDLGEARLIEYDRGTLKILSKENILQEMGQYE
jgi:transcription initiation factor IIE alpha subunit